MSVMVIVGKWCRFPLTDFHGLVWYPFARGNRIGYVWRLYLSGVTDGYIELNDVCGREVWAAVDEALEASEFNGAMHAATKRGERLAKGGR